MAVKKSCRCRARELAMVPREGAGEGTRARGCEPCARAPGLGAGINECHAGSGCEPRGPCSRRQRGLSAPRVTPGPAFRQRARAWGVHKREGQGPCGGPAWGRARRGTRPRPRGHTGGVPDRLPAMARAGARGGVRPGVGGRIRASGGGSGRRRRRERHIRRPLRGAGPPAGDCGARRAVRRAAYPCCAAASPNLTFRETKSSLLLQRLTV